MNPLRPIRSFAAVLGGMLTFYTSIQAQTTSPQDRFLRTDGGELLERVLEQDQRTQRTSLADMNETDVREAPSSVIIITSRQIQASGARDLQEALHLIPGLSFGRDVDDVVGIGIRGNWAEEGKCLFLLNGIQLNENDFGTYSIGQRIPLDNVDRIEVVMGPGSVIHGGYAALGVINIITRTAQQATGGQATISTALAEGAMARTSTTVSGNTIIGLDQELSYMANLTRGNRSNVRTVLPDGRPISFADSTAGQTAAFQFGYRWRSLKAHVYYMDEGSEVSDANYQTRMRDMILGLEQRVRLGQRSSLRWKLTHDDQIPWYYVNTLDSGRVASNTSNVRTTGSLNYVYRATDWFSVRIGGQAYRQRSRFFSRQGVEFALNNDRGITMTGAAAMLELEAKGRAGTFSAGYRTEHNSLSGNYHAPRVSYAKVLGRFHGKLLVSRAFKIPTLMNLNYGPQDGHINTEYTNTLEGEIGWRLGTTGQFTMNAYRTVINDPIVYVYDAVTLDNYVNRPSSGTDGLAMRYQYEASALSIYLGLSTYRVLSLTDLPEAQLPEPYSRVFQGMPSHRANAALAYSLTRTLTVRGKVQWSSANYSMQYTDGLSDDLSLVIWDPVTTIDVGLTVNERHRGRWSLDLGCYDLLDAQRPILSPYANGSIPLRMNGREVALKVIYRFAQQ